MLVTIEDSAIMPEVFFTVDGDSYLPGVMTRGPWGAVALHTTPGVPEFLEPEIALVTAGVETDVLGIGRGDLCAQAIQAVTAAHPRPDFKNRILRAFTDGMKHRPVSTFGTFNADVLQHFDDPFVPDDFVEIIRNNSWPE
jgi:hypothetical protein